MHKAVIPSKMPTVIPAKAGIQVLISDLSLRRFFIVALSLRIMTARCIGILFMFLLTATSTRAQIDSAQWPFPDTLDLSCKLSGIYYTSYYQTFPDQVSWDGYSYQTLVHVPGEEDGLVTKYTWKDVNTIDSSGWHCSKSAYDLSSTLDFVLDTATHRIIRLVFSYSYPVDSGSLYAQTEELAYSLTDLHYSKSGITINDSDLGKHLSLAGYQEKWLQPYSEQVQTFQHLDEFEAMGITLSNGFSYPKQVDFGTVSIGSFRDTTVTFQNFGNDTIQIGSYTINDTDGVFHILSSTLRTLPPDSGCNIAIRYQPRTAKVSSGSILDYQNMYLIQLTGSAETSDVASNQYSRSPFTAWPSIAKEGVTFLLPCTIGSLTIYNSIGQKIHFERIMNESNLLLDVHRWPNGNYIASYSSASADATTKFIVQH